MLFWDSFRLETVASKSFWYGKLEWLPGSPDLTVKQLLRRKTPSKAHLVRSPFLGSENPVSDTYNLKIFFRLYSEQSNDLKRKLSEIKEAKDIKSLSNQEIKDQLASQFEFEKKKKQSEKKKLNIKKKRLKAEKNILEKYIDELDSQE